MGLMMKASGMSFWGASDATQRTEAAEYGDNNYELITSTSARADGMTVVMRVVMHSKPRSLCKRTCLHYRMFFSRV